MTLKASTYGSVVVIQDMIGDLVDGRTFTDTTSPSLGAVERALDSTGSYLNMILKQNGYQAPVDVINEPTDEYALDFLKWANSAGAAAEVLSSTPFESSTAGLNPESEEIHNARHGYYLSVFNEAVRAIKAQEMVASRDFGGGEKGGFVSSGSRGTKPFFRRDMFEVPGTFDIGGYGESDEGYRGYP